MHHIILAGFKYKIACPVRHTIEHTENDHKYQAVFKIVAHPLGNFGFPLSDFKRMRGGFNSKEKDHKQLTEYSED